MTTRETTLDRVRDRLDVLLVNTPLGESHMSFRLTRREAIAVRDLIRFEPSPAPSLHLPTLERCIAAVRGVGAPEFGRLSPKYGPWCSGLLDALSALESLRQPTGGQP